VIRTDKTPHGDRKEYAAPAGYGVDIETPNAGYYRMQLRSGGAMCGIRIWFGQPLDPVTGEAMDRSLRWQAECNGEYIEIDQVWPLRRSAQTITEIAYNQHCQRQSWARTSAPGSALADPRRKSNPLTSPIYF
jgi:hypothetical protein